MWYKAPIKHVLKIIKEEAYVAIHFQRLHKRLINADRPTSIDADQRYEQPHFGTIFDLSGLWRLLITYVGPYPVIEHLDPTGLRTVP